MKLTLTKADQEKAGSYFDSNTCIIATALKRRFPKIKTIRVGGCELTLGRKDYDIRNFAKIHSYATKPELLPVTIELVPRTNTSRRARC
jgi:hypothetical protein